jgi:predicted ABC-class ATPase
MQSFDDLASTLRRLDGKGYKAYKDLKGCYDHGDFVLCIDHVQGDPFAAPSRLHVEVPQEYARFPKWSYASGSREVAVRDYLTRQFARSAKRIARGNRGSGKGGNIEIDAPGQEVLERTAMWVSDDRVEARFFAGLPAFGRKIAGREAQAMLLEELPEIVRRSLYFESLNERELERHVQTIEDADALREALGSRDCIAFVADESILPRRSGVDDRPMQRDEAVPFRSPESLRMTLSLPNRGEITGMAIRRGVNLIVGGGYHGKSTVLRALERGVYDHIPGDGREFVVTDERAFKIRAEDGRGVEKTCITPFIANLPHGGDTDAFSSEDASGSTSQAANIIEALEAGATTLLIDEDTSATNFMIRDHRMQELVASDDEPITPFIDKVRQLFTELGVSSVLVIGGSGDYFDVADSVVAMHEYVPEDVTEQAREIAGRYRTDRVSEGGESFGRRVHRAPLSESLNPSKGKKDVKVKARGRSAIEFGRFHIDLTSVEQLVDGGQTRAIAMAMVHAKQSMDGTRTVAQLLEEIARRMDTDGLDAITPNKEADLVRFRPLEFAAALNRLRTLRVRQVETADARAETSAAT